MQKFFNYSKKNVCIQQTTYQELINMQAHNWGHFFTVSQKIDFFLHFMLCYNLNKISTSGTSLHCISNKNFKATQIDCDNKLQKSVVLLLLCLVFSLVKLKKTHVVTYVYMNNSSSTSIAEKFLLTKKKSNIKFWDAMDTKVKYVLFVNTNDILLRFKNYMDTIINYLYRFYGFVP